MIGVHDVIALVALVVVVAYVFGVPYVLIRRMGCLGIG